MDQQTALANETGVQPLEVSSVKNICDAWLGDYFKGAVAQAQVLDPGYEALWQAAAVTTLGGGKRLRPYLLLLCYAALGGRQYEDAVPIAAAYELLHQCLLIHDDVIDRDYIRHGMPNVAGQLRPRFEALGEDAEHFAGSAAILAGDLLLSDVYAIISESSLPGHVKQQLVRTVREAVYNVAAGELMDVEAVIRTIDESDPIKVATLKTASYSFVLPLVGGALLAEASPHTVEAIQQLGTNLGIAYQIQDDILGLFGDESKTGKSTLGDLREGKHTMLIRFVLDKAPADEREVILGALGNKELSQAEAEVVRGIMRSSGAYEATRALLEAYTNKAIEVLDSLTLAADYKLAFMKIIGKLLERDA